MLLLRHQLPLMLRVMLCIPYLANGHDVGISLTDGIHVIEKSTCLPGL